MLKRLVAAALVIGVAALVYQLIPDIKRYLRIRRM
ncbi:DUF6893 family small protein [Streptosporangium sp. CA-135522]